MTERTEKDDHIDRAFEMLIDDEMESFVLVTVSEDGELESLQSVVGDHDLLAIYTMIQSVINGMKRGGFSVNSHEVTDMVAVVAAEHGLLSEGAEIEYNTSLSRGESSE